MNPNPSRSSVDSPSAESAKSADHPDSVFSASSAVKIPLARFSDGTAKVGCWRLTNTEANDVDAVADLLQTFHNHESRVRILASLVLIFRENLDDSVPRGTNHNASSPSSTTYPVLSAAEAAAQQKEK
jgi:hypothetical protein